MAEAAGSSVDIAAMLEADRRRNEKTVQYCIPATEFRLAEGHVLSQPLAKFQQVLVCITPFRAGSQIHGTRVQDDKVISFQVTQFQKYPAAPEKHGSLQAVLSVASINKQDSGTMTQIMSETPVYGKVQRSPKTEKPMLYLYASNGDIFGIELRPDEMKAVNAWA
jgi:hypothetical protein